MTVPSGSAAGGGELSSRSPGSRPRERIVANGDVLGIELSDDEVARIDDLARDERLVDPGFAPAWDAV